MYSLALLIILMGYVSLKEVGLQETDTTGSGCSTSGDFSEYTLDELTAFFIIKQNKFTNFTNLFWHETVHVSDSSSVHHQEFIHCTLSNGVCQAGLYTAVEQDQDGTAVPSWS